jgi:uncharacterized protein YbjT (DUF2867 family)
LKDENNLQNVQIAYIFLLFLQGGLGKEIVRQFLQRGYEVTAAVRDQAKATAMFAGQAVKIAQVNIDGGEGLEEAFAGVDCVLEVISNGE